MTPSRFRRPASYGLPGRQHEFSRTRSAAMVAAGSDDAFAIALPASSPGRLPLLPLDPSAGGRRARRTAGPDGGRPLLHSAPARSRAPSSRGSSGSPTTSRSRSSEAGPARHPRRLRPRWRSPMTRRPARSFARLSDLGALPERQARRDRQGARAQRPQLRRDRGSARHVGGRRQAASVYERRDGPPGSPGWP